MSEELKMGDRKQSMCKIKACSQRKKRKNTIVLLEEIVFKILAGLPAQCLHNTMRRVCSSWADTIRDPMFIKAHLSQVNPVLFFYTECRPYRGYQLEVTDGEEFRLVDSNPMFPGHLANSCDGVMLFCDDTRLCVLNPATMQSTVIPRPTSLCRWYSINFSIARVPHSFEYKLVHADTDSKGCTRWCVLTLGTHSWREINFVHGRDCCEWNDFRFPGIPVGGFLFWARISSARHMIAMDVRDESFHTVQHPVGGFWFLGCHRMGDCLSLIAEDSKRRYIMVFVLKDLPNGKWVKFHNIDSGFFNEPHVIFSFGWLKKEQLLIFQAAREFLISSRFYAYDFRTKVVRAIDGLPLWHATIVHSFTLCSWKDSVA